MLGGIISGIGQLFGGIAQKVSARRQYEREKADNLKFWNMQNAYNSPVEQMKRLKEAGLNEHLVYGNGNAIQPAGDLSVNQGDGTAGLQDIGSSINTGYQAYLQGKSIMSQNRQRDVQSDLTEQKIKSEIKSQRLQDLIIIGKDLQNQREYIDTYYKGEEKAKQLKILEQNIQANQQSLSNLMYTGQNLQQDYRNKVTENKLKQQQIKQMEQDFNFKAKNNIILLKQGKLSLDNMLQDIAVKKANIQAMQTNQEYTKTQIKALTKELKIKDIEQLERQLGISKQVIGLKYEDRLKSIETELREYEFNNRLFKPLFEQTPLKVLDRGFGK